MKNINLYISDDIRQYYLTVNKYFHMESIKQFLNYFLPNKYNYIIVNDYEISNLSIWGIQLCNNNNLKKDKINILICIENLLHWADRINCKHWYPHYLLYNNYDDDKINIYLYNHICNINKTCKYISIPMIYLYMNYYMINAYKIEPIIYTEFKEKKFCLSINKSDLNVDIKNIINKLQTIDIVDNISIYNDLLKDKSCYHNINLLNIFNKYKFIICFENSYDNGYITEKIFNCFFSKTLPIYKGSPIIKNYINENCFIDGTNINNLYDYIILLNNNEELYNTKIISDKISYSYNNENYNEELISFIESKLQPCAGD